MGLDMVEVVMGLEQRFGVSLPDQSFESVHTVADLASLILGKLRRSGDVCPTSHAFYELRRSFMACASLPRSSIRPNVALATLLPCSRRGVWNLLRGEERRLPALVPSRRGQRFLTAFGRTLAAAHVCSLIALILIANGALACLVAIPLGIFTLIVHSSVRVHVSREFPAGVVTVADAVHRIAEFVQVESEGGARLIHEYRVFEVVRTIVAEGTGTPAEKIKPETRFIDLGF